MPLSLYDNLRFMIWRGEYRKPLSSTTLSPGFIAGCLLLMFLIGGCTTLGPDFQTPEAEVSQEWLQSDDSAIKSEPTDYAQWWTVFNDPVLNTLIESAYRQNLTLQVAGIRILEARARLGIAIGELYPQLQQGRGGATSINLSDNSANTRAVELSYWDYDVGFDAAWELDIWGRFRRGIESADAQLIASIANYDDVLVSLTAEVARTYVTIRTLEERLRLARQNIELQRRSLQIADVRFRNGVVTELDVQQATALLRDTQALVPRLESALRQAQNVLSVLLGMPPSDLRPTLGSYQFIPGAPRTVAVGIPAELLRRRPDIRRAELNAAAQSARIGIAETDLYPSFTLTGFLGLQASGNAGGTTRSGDSGFGNLFESDSLEFIGGPSFRWNILNYGRLKNNIRVQDARFQQLAVDYQDTVLRAAQEVEDAMVGFLRSQDEVKFLIDSVNASQRSVEISLAQYRDGVIDYNRVVNTQNALVNGQDRLAESRGDVALNLVAMYKALGGGWEIRQGQAFVSEDNKEAMRQRTDWGRLLAPEATEVPPPAEAARTLRRPDW